MSNNLIAQEESEIQVVTLFLCSKLSIEVSVVCHPRVANVETGGSLGSLARLGLVSEPQVLVGDPVNSS